MKTLGEDTVNRSRNLESIGALAGGVAHDFNNILTVIIGACTLLEMNAANYPEQMQFVSRIRNYAERAALLTQDLLAFSRRQSVMMKSEDLTEIFRDMHSFLENTIGEGVRLETEQPGEPLVVRADRGQIEQVFMNLAANAREAMPQGGILRMGLSRITHDGTFEQLEGCPVGDYALVTVADSGSGIERENLCRIYDPYYTTKPLGTGTGLGLSVAYGIISQHNGVIHARSNPGEGTVFSVYLPLWDPQQVVEAENTAISLPGSGETILLVDSDPFMLQINAGLLEEAGYLVLSALDGEEALELLRRGMGVVSLVVIDCALFRMNGREGGWQRIVSENKVRLLLVEEAGCGQEPLDHGIARIIKPLDPLHFLEQVRSLIDGKSCDMDEA